MADRDGTSRPGDTGSKDSSGPVQSNDEGSLNEFDPAPSGVAGEAGGRHEPEDDRGAGSEESSTASGAPDSLESLLTWLEAPLVSGIERQDDLARRSARGDADAGNGQPEAVEGTTNAVDTDRPSRSWAPKSAVSVVTTRPASSSVRGRRIASLVTVLVVVSVVLGVAVAVKARSTSALADREAAAYAAEGDASSTMRNAEPKIVVIGDGTVSRAALGVRSSARWPTLLQSELHMRIATLASVGSGYAAVDGRRTTFMSSVPDVPRNAELVVLFGGAADAASSKLSIAKAATDTFAAVKARAPRAQVLVVGPVIRAGVSEAELTVVRNSLRTAAAIADLVWVDPVASGWLSDEVQASTSASVLSTADERTIASRMRTVVQDALK